MIRNPPDSPDNVESRLSILSLVSSSIISYVNKVDVITEGHVDATGKMSTMQ